MNDRVQSALKVLGIGVPPVATLEREGAFFALLEDTLIYQDAGGTRRVTLRDLTRIHSDEEGLLRVETPAGTALTASLLGYDPARVQTFFAGVRDATARAKHLPPSPLPGPGAQKTFGPSSAPSQRPAPTLGERPGAAKPGTKAGGPDDPTGRSAPTPPRERPASGPTPRATQWKPPSQNDLGGETVRIIDPSARAQTPNPVPTPSSAPAPAPATPVPSASPTSAFPAEPAPAPRPAPVVVTPAPVPVTPEDAPAESAPVVTRTRRMLARGGLAGLDARAEGVLGWVGRLRLLAAVLGLAALGLAAFQFAEGPRLTGLWTLIAGGVGALALFAFAEVTELVVALARAVAVGAGDPAADPGRSIPGDPDA